MLGAGFWKGKDCYLLEKWLPHLLLKHGLMGACFPLDGPLARWLTRPNWNVRSPPGAEKPFSWQDGLFFYTNGPLVYSNIKTFFKESDKDASCEAFSSGRGGRISKVRKFATTLGVSYFRKKKIKDRKGGGWLRWPSRYRGRRAYWTGDTPAEPEALQKQSPYGEHSTAGMLKDSKIELPGKKTGTPTGAQEVWEQPG